MEDLALITALNHSSSFYEHLFKFPGKKTIKMLFTSSGPSVLGKTVPSVLSTDPKPRAQFLPIRTIYHYHSLILYGRLNLLIKLFFYYFLTQTNAEIEWKFSRAVIEEQYRRMHLVVVPFNIISEPLKASYFALFKDKLAEVLELKFKRIYCIV